jgi:O-antigen/teichoic acid export membrane protein
MVLVLRLLIQAGNLLLVARVLGPSLFGAYAGIAALAVLLGTMTTFGIPLVLLAEASQSFQRRLRVLPYCVSTALIVGSVLLGAFIIAVSATFHGSPIAMTLVVVIGITELVIQPLLALPSVQLQARRQIAASQLVYMVPLAIRLVLILGIALLPVTNPLQAFVIGSLLAGIAGLAIASRMLPNAWPAFRHWRLARVPELRRAAGFAALSVTEKGPTEIDKSLAARLLPLATAGVYSAAARIVNAVNVPVVAMIQSALPTLFAQSRQAAGIQPKMLMAMFGATFVYSSGAALAMWLFVPVIAWMLGDAYTGIGEALGLLCLAIPGTTLRLTSGAVLIARHQPWARVFNEASGVVVVIVAAIALAPKYGIIGMIGAYVAAEWMMAVIATGLVIRHRAS